MSYSKEFVQQVNEIRKEMNVPKTHYNDFANFHYRSLEDIEEAAKPILAEKGFLLSITDSIVNIGNRYYVEATSILTNGEEALIATGYAREQEQKSKMDESQVTGSASSYARKYSLNALFQLDDVRDADSMDNASEADGADDKKKYSGTAKGKSSGKIYCIKCKKAIPAEIKMNDGAVWSAQRFSKEFGGKCPDCVRRDMATHKS